MRTESISGACRWTETSALGRPSRQASVRLRTAAAASTVRAMAAALQYCVVAYDFGVCCLDDEQKQVLATGRGLLICSIEMHNTFRCLPYRHGARRDDLRAGLRGDAHARRVPGLDADRQPSQLRVCSGDIMPFP